MSIKIKGYIATSADGYIATNNGSVEFLAPFQDIDTGYNDFIKNIDIVIMGRKTYEVIVFFDGAWPYPNQKGFIVSSNPNLELAHPSLSLWNSTPLELVNYLKDNFKGNVWVVGGTQLQNIFIENNLLDSLEVYIMPIFLGDGIPLFPRFKTNPRHLKYISAEMIQDKIIKKIYVF